VYGVLGTASEVFGVVDLVALARIRPSANSTKYVLQGIAENITLFETRIAIFYDELLRKHPRSSIGNAVFWPS
ncbi:hypothetical protein EIP91_010557, partial [Steccherinum ochraceum]